MDDNYRVNNGYYTDNNGVPRDIRDVDFLAMLNIFGASNILEARDWSNYQSSPDQDIHMRTALSREKIKSMTVSPVFEGYSRRVTLDNNFLFALAQGIADAGVQFQTVMGDGNPLSNMRASLPWLQQMAMFNQNSTAFVNRQPYQTTNSQNQAPQAFGIYGGRATY